MLRDELYQAAVANKTRALEGLDATDRALERIDKALAGLLESQEKFREHRKTYETLLERCDDILKSDAFPTPN